MCNQFKCPQFIVTGTGMGGRGAGLGGMVTESGVGVHRVHVHLPLENLLAYLWVQILL